MSAVPATSIRSTLSDLISAAATSAAAIGAGLAVAHQYLDLPSGAAGHDAALDRLANLVNDERVGFSKGRKRARLRADIANFKRARGRKGPFPEQGSGGNYARAGLDKFPPRNTALGGLLNFFRTRYRELCFDASCVPSIPPLLKNNAVEKTNTFAKTNAHTAVKTICSQDHTPGQAAYPGQKISPVSRHRSGQCSHRGCVSSSLHRSRFKVEFRPILPSKQWFCQ